VGQNLLLLRSATAMFQPITREVQQFTQAIIGAAVQLQDMQIRLKQVSGSQAEANKLFAEVSKYEKLTPFELPEIINSTVRLRALGFTAKQTIEQLKEAGELSALTRGRVHIENFVNALGKIEGGSALGFKTLREQVGLSIAKLKELGGPVNSRGQILLRTRTDIEAAQEAVKKFIQETTGFKLAEAASQSLSGRFSTLKSEIFLTAAAFGETLIPTLIYFTNIAIGVMQWFQNLNPAVLRAIADTAMLVTSFTALASIAATVGYAIMGIRIALGLMSTGALGAILGTLSALAGPLGLIAAGAAGIHLMTSAMEDHARAIDQAYASADGLNSVWKAGLDTTKLTTEELRRWGKTSVEVQKEIEATRQKILAANEPDLQKGKGNFTADPIGWMQDFGDWMGQHIKDSQMLNVAPMPWSKDYKPKTLPNPWAKGAARAPSGIGSYDQSQLPEGDLNLFKAQIKQMRDAIAKSFGLRGQEKANFEGMTTPELQDAIQLTQKKIQLGRLDQAEAVKRFEELRNSTRDRAGFEKQDMDLQVLIHGEKKKLRDQEIKDIQQAFSHQEALGKNTLAMKSQFLIQEISLLEKYAKAEKETAGQDRYAELNKAKHDAAAASMLDVIRADRIKKVTAQLAGIRDQMAGSMTPEQNINLLRQYLSLQKEVALAENMPRSKKTGMEIFGAAGRGAWLGELAAQDSKASEDTLDKIRADQDKVIQLKREQVRIQEQAQAELLRMTGHEFQARRMLVHQETEDAIRSGVDQTTAYATQTQKRHQIDLDEYAQKVKILEEFKQANIQNQRSLGDLRLQNLQFRQGRGENVASDIQTEISNQSKREIDLLRSQSRTRIADLEKDSSDKAAQDILTERANLAEGIYRIEKTLEMKLRDLRIQEEQRRSQEVSHRLQFAQEKAQAEFSMVKAKFQEALDKGESPNAQRFGDSLRRQTEGQIAILREKARQDTLTASTNDAMTIQKQLDLDILKIRQDAAAVLKDQLKTIQDQIAAQNKAKGAFSLGGITDGQGKAIESTDPLAQMAAKDAADRAQRKAEVDLRKAEAELKRQEKAAQIEAANQAGKVGIDPKTGEPTGGDPGGRQGTAARMRANKAELDRILSEPMTRASAQRADELRAEQERLSRSFPEIGTKLPGGLSDAASGAQGAAAAGAAAAGDPNKIEVGGEVTVLIKVESPGGNQQQTGKALLQPRPSPYSNKIPPGQRGSS
jgi:hypothetical protein